MALLQVTNNDARRVPKDRTSDLDSSRNLTILRRRAATFKPDGASSPGRVATGRSLARFDGRLLSQIKSLPRRPNGADVAGLKLASG